MPDIIDNRTTKLTDRIKDYLEQSRSAHFAVGYLYLGGFEAIAAGVGDLDRLRLLIGPATNRETAEEIARGYRVENLIRREWRTHVAPRRVDRSGMHEETRRDARETISLMEQTNDNQEAIEELAGLIANGIVDVRVYTRQPLHAKCYIFDERDPERADTDPGHVIVGSSNLTVSGITSNTELNVVMHEPSAHAEVTEWFEELWENAEEFSPELLQEVENSWAVNEEVTPWQIYIKTLYNLFRDQFEAEQEPVEVIDDRWPDLAEFQEKAYNHAKAILRKYGGVMIADVVGLGKSYIGVALLKWARDYRNKRGLIVCPASLEEMWRAYSQEFDLGAPVLSMGKLTIDEDEAGERHSILEQRRYDADIVLIDESHNLRHSDTQRYECMDTYFDQGERDVIMLTATPMATAHTDIKNQLRLWPGHGENLPTGPWTFKEFFSEVEKASVELPEFLRNVMIRRPRWYVADTFGEWRMSDGTVCDVAPGEEPPDGARPIIEIGDREFTFPERELREPTRYRIDEAYAGIYDTIRTIIDPEYRGDEPLDIEAVLQRVDVGRECVGDEPISGVEREELKRCLRQRLTYARYGLHDYVYEPYREKEPYIYLATAGANLRGLIRTMVFKRLESSVDAFRRTCRRLGQMHRRFLAAMERDAIPAGEETQRALYDLGLEEVTDSEVLEAIEKAQEDGKHRYSPKAFDTEKLVADLEADAQLFEAMYYMVCNIRPADDAKLQRLRELLTNGIPEDEKAILFTQYEDTARYIYDELKDDPDVDWISGSRSPASIIGRFAPRSNPALARRYSAQPDIRILISTDVLSEGLNLQDAHYVINYDLHFNPVRLIQRMGRIDRLMPYFADDEVRAPQKVWADNFFPETKLDAHLNLRQKVEWRVKEMRQIVGVEAPVLHPSERIDRDGVIRLYTGDSSVAEDQPDEEEVRSGLLQAERVLRQLEEERPGKLQEIADLPDGVRSVREGSHEGQYFVFCEAGSFQRLYLVDEEGEVIATNLREALDAIECEEDEPRGTMPEDINRIVTGVKQQFDEAVNEMKGRQERGPSLSRPQKYVLSHLREQWSMSSDEDEKKQIDALISAYQQSVSTAVRRRLYRLQDQKAEGIALRKQLMRIYGDHELWRKPKKASQQESTRELIPRIICSEAL